MTTQLTPIAVGDQIISLPTSLADSINSSRQRFDAMKEEEEDPEEEADETDDEESAEDKGMSFAAKMKAAKAKKAAKKDSDDIDSAIDHIDSLEAENEVLAALLQGYQGDSEDEESHEDADEMSDEGYMDDRTPQEIALEMLEEFEDAKPFLNRDASIANYRDIYDIYEDAINTRYPGLLMDHDLEDMEGMDCIDPDNEDQLKGAFLLMLHMANPMQGKPMAMSLDSADRSFAAALGVRKDSAALRPAPTPTAYY